MKELKSHEEVFQHTISLKEGDQVEFVGDKNGNHTRYDKLELLTLTGVKGTAHDIDYGEFDMFIEVDHKQYYCFTDDVRKIDD